MMLRILTPSPKANTTIHASREIGGVLINLGFAEEIAQPKPDPIEGSRTGAAKPRGWSIVHGGQNGDKLLLRFDDGQGEFVLLERKPAPLRTYVPPKAGEEDGHYEMRVSLEIPDNVWAEFLRQGGGPRDVLAESDRGSFYRDRINQQQYAQDEQNRKHVRFF